MDILSHIFLPLILIYGAGLNKIKDSHILVLSSLSIVADYDVLFNIHRSFLHSPLLVALITLPLIYIGKKKGFYAQTLFASFFLFSHILLDFFAGGIPFLYPFTPLCVGFEFPLVLKFGSSISIEELGPRLTFSMPSVLHETSIDAFSGFGMVSFILFLFIFLRRKS